MFDVGGRAARLNVGAFRVLTHKRHLAREGGRGSNAAGESFQKCNEVRFLKATQAKWIDFCCSTWTINAASIVQVYYRRVSAPIRRAYRDPAAQRRAE
jgi:hypothetical protein